MHKGIGKVNSFHAIQSIKNYFLDLEMKDLVGIAHQYGVSLEKDCY